MRPAPTADRGRLPTVIVCRGCCCGTAKVPGVEHEAQLADLSRGLRGIATVRTAPCLGLCEEANLIVLQPAPAGRAAGGRPVWLGCVREPDTVADVIAWVRAGGPGQAAVPLGLVHLVVRPPGRTLRMAVR
ncbi:(2Fe-2S) ferredoxin domain-containing protein [Streptomyces sp. NBC_00154]|uniref:(2Fe-2S) ferredoxin domain-containing protein n=1 Tax=Streptomyces sp. NBC_00154 TaxID=2975670 RepID=UPI00225618D1|nr:(2Fe-2S) ferredoxin domain-containing protein [Streptomyces sp. NBC_00154]MCX5315995.1 (2Fe-2S) ferredoxin domain-containing protein [Streptomyces sp. NBC_00154]